MHLDNKRLQSIQQLKALINKKIANTDDDYDKKCFKEKYDLLCKEEKRILNELNNITHIRPIKSIGFPQKITS